MAPIFFNADIQSVINKLRGEGGREEMSLRLRETERLIAFPEYLFNENQLRMIQDQLSSRVTRIRVDGQLCIAVPEEEAKRVCSILGEDFYRTRRVATDYEGINLAVVDGRSSSSPRTVSSPRSSMVGYFFAPLPHELQNVRSTIVEPPQDPGDDIFLPYSQRRGVSLDDTNSSEPSFEVPNIPQRRSTGGAEYLIAPFPYELSSSMRSVRPWDDSGSPKETFLEEGRGGAQPTDRDCYISMCIGSGYQDRIKKTEGEIKQLSSDVERLQYELVAALRAVEEKQTYLGKLRSNEDGSGPGRFGKEFDALFEHPDIQNVKVFGNKIEVYTKPISLEITHQGFSKRTCTFGSFRIVIYCDGFRGGVRMFNVTRTVNGNHHPHINSEGEPCLGNIKEVIPHLIAERQYAALISVCIQFLKTYTREQGFKPFGDIELWR